MLAFAYAEKDKNIRVNIKGLSQWVEGMTLPRQEEIRSQRKSPINWIQIAELKNLQNTLN